MERKDQEKAVLFMDIRMTYQIKDKSILSTHGEDHKVIK